MYPWRAVGEIARPGAERLDSRSPMTDSRPCHRHSPGRDRPCDQQAGTWLAAEFARPDGPRFSDNVTAPIDTEIELFLRDRLTALLPARFVGEEAGVLAAPSRTAIAGWSIRMTAPAPSWKAAAAAPSRSPCCATARPSWAWSTPRPAPTAVPT